MTVEEIASRIAEIKAERRTLREQKEALTDQSLSLWAKEAATGDETVRQEAVALSSGSLAACKQKLDALANELIGLEDELERLS